mmetsp:Transcript_99551/g.307061  ORF Transcript_99551/g.307061 Transcript_99551/m.307061 type:complete len:342 (-) Transcript_99551:1256-2281(-)
MGLTEAAVDLAMMARTSSLSFTRRPAIASITSAKDAKSRLLSTHCSSRPQRSTLQGRAPPSAALDTTRLTVAREFSNADSLSAAPATCAPDPSELASASAFLVAPACAQAAASSSRSSALAASLRAPSSTAQTSSASSRSAMLPDSSTRRAASPTASAARSCTGLSFFPPGAKLAVTLAQADRVSPRRMRHRTACSQPSPVKSEALAAKSSFAPASTSSSKLCFTRSRSRPAQTGRSGSTQLHRRHQSLSRPLRVLMLEQTMWFGLSPNLAKTPLATISADVPLLFFRLSTLVITRVYSTGSFWASRAISTSMSVRRRCLSTASPLTRWKMPRRAGPRSRM